MTSSKSRARVPPPEPAPSNPACITQPPETSAALSTATTMSARDRMLRLREKSGPSAPEDAVHAREDLRLASSSIDDRNRAHLVMSRLPLRRRELLERRSDTLVKTLPHALDAIVRATTGDTRQPFLRREREEHGEVGCEPTGGETVRRHDLVVGEPAAGALIGIRRQEETVEQHDRTSTQRRTQHACDELGARRHEQQRFCVRGDVRLRLEQNASNL